MSEEVNRKCPTRNTFFSARQHIMLWRAICHRPSVCPSHGWISQRRLKLGSCNLHWSSPMTGFLMLNFTAKTTQAGTQFTYPRQSPIQVVTMLDVEPLCWFRPMQWPCTWQPLLSCRHDAAHVVLSRGCLTVMLIYMVGCRTRDWKVASSTPGWGTIKLARSTQPSIPPG